MQGKVLWGLTTATVLFFLLGLGYFALALNGADQPGPALSLTSATVTRGTLGRDLETTLTGAGFDESTRLSLILDVGNSHAIVGILKTWANLQEVAVAGSYAYLANSHRGLQIADISHPERPRIIGSLKTVGKVWDVAVTPGWAFVADNDGGLLVVDIHDPAEPRLAAKHSASRPVALTLRGDRVYMVTIGGELLVFDVERPESPQLVATVETGNLLWDIAVAEDYAYVTSPRYGLQIFDLSHPADPFQVGELTAFGGFFAVEVAAHTAFVTTRDKRLLAVDVSLPGTPRLAAETDLPNIALNLELREGRAYAACGTSGTLVVDDQDPDHLEIVGRISTGNDRGLELVGDLAYIAGSRSGLKIVDLRRALSPQKLAALDTDGHTHSLALAQGKAFLADGDKGLKVIDISDPFQPRLLGTRDTPGTALDIAVAHETAFVADGPGGLRIIDISDPERPVFIGHLLTNGPAKRITLWQEKAFLLEASTDPSSADRPLPNRITVIDVSDPRSPRLLTSFRASFPALDLAVSGGNVYLASSSDGLRTLAFTGADGFRLVSAATLPWPQQSFASATSLKTRGPLAYLANGRKGLQTLDISDPLQPRILVNFDLPGYAADLAVGPGRAYLLDRHFGIRAVDITDPANTRLTGSIALPDSPESIEATEEALYVANGNNGLLILPLPVSAELQTLHDPTRMSAIFPTPPMPGRYLLQAFNRNGSAVLGDVITIDP